MSKNRISWNDEIQILFSDLLKCSRPDAEQGFIYMLPSYSSEKHKQSKHSQHQQNLKQKAADINVIITVHLS